VEKMVENGIVCFLDILGYQNIINNNSINECAKIIKSILIDMPKNVTEGIFKYTAKNKNSINSIIEKVIRDDLNIIVVSDSIILFFDIEKEINFDYILMTSLGYITRFFYKSFELGFPMRGCIDIGQFYYNENIFAGDSVVKTYNESNKLDFAGVVITSKLFEYIEKINKTLKKTANERIFKYLAPLKDNKEEYKYILKWFNIDDYNNNSDIRQYVFKSFQKYNKDINTSALRKLNNTENMLRYFLIKENELIQ
jgi:hypothetical protein